MPTRSRRAAVDAALARFQRAATCITNRPVITPNARSSVLPAYFGFAPVGTSVPLRAANGSWLALSMEHDYVVDIDGAGDFVVHTIGYRYHLLDADEREILAYHWHPIGVSSVTFPHLHLSGRLAPLVLGPR